MFGGYFYNARIRKAVAVFGSLFNDIQVMRQNSSGNVISQQKVPLSYAPKRDFLARLDEMQSGELAERQVAVKLPRMSFEILGMNYDASRQIPKMNSCPTYPESVDGTGKKLFAPVPYNIQFSLNIYAKSQDDALQIVEQILPYFTPNYTMTIKPIDDLDLKEDTPITFQGISFSDDYEAALEARRSIIYTLDFEMKITLYKDTTSNIKIVEKACIQFASLDGSELFSKVCTDSAYSIEDSMLVGTNAEDNVITKSITIKNVPSDATSITASVPDKGTATATLSKLTTNANGIVTATGSWEYTPNTDYFGVDSFNVELNGGFGKKIFPVGITVTPVSDTITDFVTTAQDTPVTFTVGTNDSFSSTALTFNIASGGEPSNGTIVILNAATGEFRYTPNNGFTGSDTATYRVTPDLFPSGSETGTINITVTL